MIIVGTIARRGGAGAIPFEDKRSGAIVVSRESVAREPGDVSLLSLNGVRVADPAAALPTSEISLLSFSAVIKPQELEPSISIMRAGSLIVVKDA